MHIPNLAPSDEGSRKRPFSSISGGELSTPQPIRQAPWGSDHGIQPLSAPADRFRKPFYSPHDLTPKPLAIKPIPAHQLVGPAEKADNLPQVHVPDEIDEAAFDL